MYKRQLLRWYSTLGIPPMRNTIRCLRFTKSCLVGKRKNIAMKPPNSPTRGQPNPRKIRSKVAFWGTFAPRQQFFFFSWGLGLSFVQETGHKKPNRSKILRKHPILSRVQFSRGLGMELLKRGASERVARCTCDRGTSTFWPQNISE